VVILGMMVHVYELSLVGMQGFSHTIKTLNPHFSATTTYIVEVAASVNYMSSWTSPIILHMRDIVI
jgi:hypothetical protein